MSLRDGGLWPFTKQGICGGQIPNKFTFFKKIILLEYQYTQKMLKENSH